MSDVTKLQKVLEVVPAVQLAVVFGSFARGRELPGSDLDLGLILSPDSRAMRREIEATAGRSAGRDIDIVYLAETPPLLSFQIARDGMVLVERQDGAWSRFKSRAMIEWWDWAPTVRKIQATQLRRLRERVAHGSP